MKIEEQIIFWTFVSIVMIINYLIATSLIMNFKNNLEKDSPYRKILLYLSIIPIVNFVVMLLLLLGIVFEYLIGELIDAIKEIKEGFKNEKN
nr:MAG TPA: hypothetical protein [Caudoviricetes sp.]